MPTDLIRYDLLCQDALRSVVARVLKDAAKSGLPGDHHFYVTFDTRAPGVRLSQRMREKYPERMTVVLQHQFWDLAATEHAFEVGLSFGGIPERLLVPFTALVEFVDPSVQFALQFEIASEPAKAEETAAPEPARDASETARARFTGGERPAPKGAASKSPTPKGAASEPAEAGPAQAEPVQEKNGGAQIVSIDKFRKK